LCKWKRLGADEGRSRMTREDIDNIISIICPNDEDFEKLIISPAYLKKELETLKIYHSHLTGEIVELNRISTVEAMLQQMESEIRIPDKPADRIRK
jgi:hypothetical protein